MAWRAITRARGGRNNAGTALRAGSDAKWIRHRRACLRRLGRASSTKRFAGRVVPAREASIASRRPYWAMLFQELPGPSRLSPVRGGEHCAPALAPRWQSPAAGPWHRGNSRCCGAAKLAAGRGGISSRRRWTVNVGRDRRPGRLLRPSVPLCRRTVPDGFGNGPGCPVRRPLASSSDFDRPLSRLVGPLSGSRRFGANAGPMLPKARGALAVKAVARGRMGRRLADHVPADCQPAGLGGGVAAICGRAGWPRGRSGKTGRHLGTA